MAFETIVFSQQELDNALESGHINIGLCDNHFVLPKIGNVRYTAIGDVTARADGTSEEFIEHNVIFDGFFPEFTVPKKLPFVAVKIPTSSSSFATSYMLSSYFMTSYKYQYEYEYEYQKGSFTTSYTTSWSTSYSSFASSLQTPYAEGCVMVNGYGINLI